eukprot:4971880-Prymnesium_polylepis.1
MLRGERFETYQHKSSTFDVYTLAETPSGSAMRVLNHMRQHAIYATAMADGVLSPLETMRLQHGGDKSWEKKLERLRLSQVDGEKRG